MKWTEFAVREARQTLSDWEQQYGKLQPPVPVEDIADLLYLLAIDLTSDLPATTAGRLYAEERIIEVNRSDTHVRQRFTIAHEIGHYRLHVRAEDVLRNGHMCSNEAITATAEPLLFPDSEEPISNLSHSVMVSTRRLEVEANGFAAELLMPALLIEAAIAQYGLEIAHLAHLFNVSVQAMQYRLEKLLFLRSGLQTNFLTEI